MTTEQLAQLQALFGEQLARDTVALHTFAPWLADDDATARRFTRYQASLRHSHARSLTLVYPVLQELVGDAFFRTLAHAYGDAHPSRDGDLSRFGEQLASFVARLPSAAAYPYFADIARVEWSLHEANQAADATPLSAGDLAVARVEEVETWRLDLHPAATLHASAWRIGAIWLAHRQPDSHALPASIDAPSRTLVYRAGWTPTLRELDASEWAALTALASGATLGDALSTAIAQPASDDAPNGAPPFDPLTALQGWLADGLLVRPQRP
ncbi:hypothetical protein BTH42_32785 [Burkholderia sp. SRS-W-2-2016]|uniref:HvfC/BufC N-terminal domain-containing protein n=1 Tax=Burkholderia sp. SRS-W-2-2016 TaxID=1926878 RepID=UPI00094B53FD|nr:DNA-binding domain-containing protein [Burkholderia sp. SRS-W-2-2016]OLL27383.1 hypothetical protein BTH42_32785 [Burkholderia sp. SRS-W-2-2016]